MVNPLRQGGVIVVPVDARLRHEHVTSLAIQTAPRPALRNLAGNLPIDL